MNQTDQKMRNRWEAGQSFVEMAIGMVVLILLLGGLFDIGRAFLILVSVENATGEGALYGATHPACLTNDHSASICQGTESVVGRVQEEGDPVISLTASDVKMYVNENATWTNNDITAGNVLRVDVRYQYSPITPIGFLLWGGTAEVSATARQQIMSPPPPGYQY